MENGKLQKSNAFVSNKRQKYLIQKEKVIFALREKKTTPAPHKKMGKKGII